MVFKENVLKYKIILNTNLEDNNLWFKNYLVINFVSNSITKTNIFNLMDDLLTIL